MGDRFGVSEVDVVNSVVEAVCEPVRAEQRLEEGMPALLGSSPKEEMPPPPTLPAALQPETAEISDLECIRTKMRSVLEESYRNGSLRTVLAGLENDIGAT